MGVREQLAQGIPCLHPRIHSQILKEPVGEIGFFEWKCVIVRAMQGLTQFKRVGICNLDQNYGVTTDLPNILMCLYQYRDGRSCFCRLFRLTFLEILTPSLIVGVLRAYLLMSAEMLDGGSGR